jgi:mono/diheme cytochrome c family protein
MGRCRQGTAKRCVGALVVVLLAKCMPAAYPQAPPAFEKSFAAIVIKNCLACHNPSQKRGGLDLSRPQEFFKGGDSGPAVEAGKPEDSFLIERVAEGSMPPRPRPRLSAADVAALRAWVRAGAKWPRGRVLSEFEFTTDHRAGYDWWSLHPVRSTAPPARPRRNERVTNPIDGFILAELKKHGLELAPPADKVTLLRRAKYDLFGLPPTPGEIDAFLADGSPTAYERLIDRLLASPHYGERWGRHWLDVVRYGESDGFEHDKLREHAWRYRDYVIGSFNADKPYDRFIKEQLAGDVLEPVTPEGRIATGFLVAGPWDEIQNVAQSKLERMRTHEEQMEELIGAVAQTFLGMTVNCARCHDHKFDPILQTDYYRMKAVFDGVDHGNMPILSAAEQQVLARAAAPVQARIKELTASLDRLEAQGPGDAAASKTDHRILTEGRFGKALNARFGHAMAPAKAIYHRPPLTVECWARVYSKAGINILAAANPKESSDHWEIYTYAGTGGFSAYLPGYAPAEIKSGVDITDGKWHYVAMLFDGQRVRLFVDTRLVQDSAVKRQKTGGPAGPLYFGAYLPHQLGCDGAVDEVRISHTLRSIDRVPAGPFSADRHTIGLWHFDTLERDRFKDAAPALNPAELSHLRERQAALMAERAQEEARLSAYAVPLAYSGVRRQPERTVVFLRGDIRKPGPEVTGGALSAVRGLQGDLALTLGAPEGQRRLRFAEWVAHPDHPLTARVLANRLWQYHFGRGLIATPSDFGWNGSRPSHPELLDWLARRFRDSGGSIKAMHRLIMLSATYRQLSGYSARAARLDADNRLLWRFAPRRLEAEIIRDAMLAVSGELNPQIGGPSFRPFTVTVFNTHFYHLFDRGTPEFNRRTVYRINVNTAKNPLLEALDCPAPSITMPRRRSTTTPLQALAMMNDSFVQRQADRFAHRVEQRAGNDPDAQVTRAFRLALGRLPDAEELAGMRKLVDEHGLPSGCWVLFNASEFLYVK